MHREIINWDATVQWPAGFDQPYIANELDHLGVAKELIQIRGGASFMP